MSESGGFMYRFPDRDFQLGIGSRVPEVGETLGVKGRMWKVARVTRGADNRAVLHLEPFDKLDEPESPFSPD